MRPVPPRYLRGRGAGQPIDVGAIRFAGAGPRGIGYKKTGVPAPSGAGAEVEPDDRRKDMFWDETPEMQPAWDRLIDLGEQHKRQQAIQDQQDEKVRGYHREEGT